MRKVDQLKELLESQELDPDNWDKVEVEIEERKLRRTRRIDQVNLLVRSAEVGFGFDKTGEKFLGIYNWKE